MRVEAGTVKSGEPWNGERVMNTHRHFWIRIAAMGGLLLGISLLGGEANPNVAAAHADDPWRTVGLAGAAAFAVGVSILGAGYAVAKIGSAALGAAVEKPELLIRSLLFVALAEGLAVLGFAVAMLLMQRM